MNLRTYAIGLATAAMLAGCSPQGARQQTFYNVPDAGGLDVLVTQVIGTDSTRYHVQKISLGYYSTSARTANLTLLTAQQTELRSGGIDQVQIIGQAPEGVSIDSLATIPKMRALARIFDASMGTE